MTAVEAPPRETPERDLPSAGSLLFGALGGAAAWALQLAILDMAVELGCFGGWPRRTEYGSTTMLTLVVVGVTVVALLVTAAAWLTSFARWRNFRNGADDPGVERTAFLAISGLLADALFFVLIVLTGIAPLFFLGTCIRR
jgi:hypothetical protein